MKSQALLLAPEFRLHAALRHSPRFREKAVALAGIRFTRGERKFI
jgi:hypothetical protein